MYSQNNLTVGQWCDRWFCENQSRWSGRTVGGYRNLIDRHISPGIGNIPLTELTQDTVTSFYDSLQSRGCPEPPAEAHKTVPLRLGQLQRYLNAAEQFGTLPLIYTGLSSGLRQCELLTLSWADFYVRYRYILKGQRLLTLGSKAEHLLEQIPETGRYVFLNPKTGVPYQLHEFYYLHKRILKQAGLPWVAFRDLQRQCRKVGL